ncbi:ABC transporter permease [Facklamia miroungae]|uniref:Putative ABC transport system permease protein n=1 Tax=Facklamia miroungae TaxID=120956 RepID=A0A1G7TS37_9LACT|nr:iron export ABC transporter permease subunit FetB [Facklamia miroungae]NKZ29945.1 iron export ABC transporter permease subunit FetB [Facklamia miroungae]SDG37992.1 putative ABC transport system permease protein [Facklamia miroungae]
MTQNLQVSPLSLALTFSLVLITFFISYREKLDLWKDLLIAIVRVIVQLLLVGYVLEQIFAINNTWITLAMVAVIIFNASWNASKHGSSIKNAFAISLIAIGAGSIVSLGILVFSGSLKFTPSQIVPITGMISGTAMAALGLTFRNLKQLFEDHRQAFLEMLALGATPQQATTHVKKLAVKSGIQPTIDNIKTTGVVTLPGMMSGLIFAGVDPTKAIMYQIMISFTILGTTALVAATAAHLSIRTFFNDQYQLIFMSDNN